MLWTAAARGDTRYPADKFLSGCPLVPPHWNAALADGAVRFFTNDMLPELLEAMATVAGAEAVREP
jgi:hypothetical protein